MDVASEAQLERLLQFLKSDPTNSKLRADAAEAAIAAGRPHQAIELIEEASAVGAAAPELLNLAGVAAMNLGEFDRAAVTFEALLSADPDNAAVAANLAWCRAKNGAWPQVSNLLKDDIAAETPLGATLKIQALHHQGLLEDALAWGMGAAKRYPYHPALNGALAAVAIDAEELELANHYSAAAGEHPQGLSTRGMLLLADEKPEVALDVFQRGLQVDPNDGRAQLGMGLALLAIGESAGAVPWLDRSAERFRTHLGSWVAAAWAHFATGDLQGSRERFQRAEQIDPAFAEVQGGLAVLDIMDGRLESARTRAKQALRLDRDCFAGALAQVMLLSHDGQPEAAERLREKAMNAPAGPGGKTIAQAASAFGRMRSR